MERYVIPDHHLNIEKAPNDTLDFEKSKSYVLRGKR
jgi:hypothetical protein